MIIATELLEARPNAAGTGTFFTFKGVSLDGSWVEKTILFMPGVVNALREETGVEEAS